MRTHTDHRRAPAWVRLLLALALAAGTAGCLDQALEQRFGEAEPDATPTQTLGVVPQFDQDARRVALPNDAVLASVIEAGLFSGDGTATNVPIRIPFSGPIAYPFDGKHTPDAAELTAWGQKLFIFPADSSNPAADAIPALTTTAGGTFEAVYQDSNNDLVLVPGPSTFANDQTAFNPDGTPKTSGANPYVVVVTKGITDASGTPIDVDSATYFTQSTSPLVDATGDSVSAVLTDAQATSLERLRQSLKPAYDGLAAAGIPRSNIALLFTFSTEGADSTSPTTGSGALVGGMEAVVGANVPDDAALMWATADGTTGLPSTPQDGTAGIGDFKAVFAAQGAPVDAIASVHMGLMPCLTFMEAVTPSALAPGGWGAIADATPVSSCPSVNYPNMLEFWLSIPSTGPTGVVVFLHGITRNKDDFAAIANSLAAAGKAVIAIDIWGHGSRAYTQSGQPVEFIQPSNPELSAGFLNQTRMDVARAALMALGTSSSELSGLIGGSTPYTVDFVGQSLGAMIGSLTASSSTTYFTGGTVLNASGGDLTDVILESPAFQSEVFAGVSAVTGEPVGSADLNATLLGLELLNRHALFATLSDPLAVYDPSDTTPAPLLMQQMTGDAVVPNNDTELLSRVMGIPQTATDGDGSIAMGAVPTPYQVRWIYDPANYTETGLVPGATADHGFLLNNETTATAAAQSQVVMFLSGAGVEDPLAP